MLVSALSVDHLHHPASLETLTTFERPYAVCAAHTFAEIYATLTGKLPRRSPEVVLLLMQDLYDRLDPVPPSARLYQNTIQAAARAGLTGGAIYDALIGASAIMAKVDVLYTWNTRDFLRLPDPIPSLVRRPGQ